VGERTSLGEWNQIRIELHLTVHDQGGGKRVDERASQMGMESHLTVHDQGRRKRVGGRASRRGIELHRTVLTIGEGRGWVR
jgi:hypothetical protein